MRGILARIDGYSTYKSQMNWKNGKEFLSITKSFIKRLDGFHLFLAYFGINSQPQLCYTLLICVGREIALL
jgi:hypothetical protein